MWTLNRSVAAVTRVFVLARTAEQQENRASRLKPIWLRPSFLWFIFVDTRDGTRVPGRPTARDEVGTDRGT